MATTTTNYGFDVPTSSDLVKNGATAISTLGQDLDTFLFRPFTRNAVLNSSFNVWQRGTSLSNNSTGTSGYNADRWQNYLNGTITVSRQATNDTTNLPFIQYCARVQRNSGTTSTGVNYLNQNMETVNSVAYAGKQVTFSFYARAGANYSAASSALSAAIQTGTGTDQNIFGGYTGGANSVSGTATLTTTWQRFSYTGTIPATTTEMCVTFQNTPTGTAGANDYYEITGVMVEVGNQVSPYCPATPTQQAELAACQRYYYRLNAGGAYSRFALGIYSASTGAEIIVNLPVTLRIVPTAVETSTIGNYFLTDSVNNQALTGMGISTHSTLNTILITPSISGGGTQFRPAELISNNSTTTYLGFSAEL
jgi:hypothetical protein